LFQVELESLTVINDGLGVQVGDSVLVRLAGLLGELTDDLPDGLLGRINGDEFAIAFRDTDTTPDPETLVGRIRAELADIRFLDEHPVVLGTAVAVVDGMTGALRAPEAMRRVDATLRRVKLAGKGNWDYYDAGYDRSHKEDLGLAMGLPGAEAFGDLGVVFRQRRSLADRSLIALEVLSDWNHPELGPLGPERTLDLAEQSGCTPLLRTSALNQACGYAAEWHRLLGDRMPPIVLNLARSQVLDADCGQEILAAVAAADLDPRRLRIGLPVDAFDLDSITAIRLNLEGKDISVEVHGVTGAPAELVALE
jgi:predicted signal transduction protein with EAL and GGDEF domain